MSETFLDKAYLAMDAAPDDPRARLAFFDRMASAELFLLLAGEPEGNQVTPRLFPVEDGHVALVFDTEERLSDLAGAAPYAALTGRQLAPMLKGQGIGLGLNLGVAPSSFLLDQNGLEWFADVLTERSEVVQVIPSEAYPPSGFPEILIGALDAKLAGCGGLASSAYLSGVTYGDGARSHLLGFVDAVPGAEGALSEAIREALAFSGIEAGVLDVVFLRATDPIAAKLSTVALRFDLPQPEEPTAPKSLGSDPGKPPILR